MESSHIAFSMTVLLETAPVEAANSAISWRTETMGAIWAIRFIREGGGGEGGEFGTFLYQCVRTCPAPTHVWLPQTPQSSKPNESCRGRKQVCPAHVHHH